MDDNPPTPTPARPTPQLSNKQLGLIRQAFGKDLQQYFIDSLTPDRGCDLPIHSLAELFANALPPRAAARLALEGLCALVESTEVKQSTKNANATFIDTRDWCGIVGAAIEARHALALLRDGAKTQIPSVNEAVTKITT